VGNTAEVRETNPLIVDSDGDGCLDGVEGYLGTHPQATTGNSARCPASLTSNQLKFFRACRWNEPPNGYGGGLWDAEYDGNSADDAEWDPDGDGISCQSGGNVIDFDNDNGTGTGLVAPVEIADIFEIKGYNLNPASKDTDGDGCADWIEIVDVNGDRTSNILDVFWVAKRAFGTYPASTSDAVLDIDKNGTINIGDILLAGKNSALVKSHSVCPSEG
jgi:hypothetical protein